MPTECIPDFFGFEPVEGRAVVAAFDAGAITSDAGALLLGATDRAIGMMDRLASCFHDVRCPELIEHEVVTLVGQRVFGMGHASGSMQNSRATPRSQNQRKEAMIVLVKGFGCRPVTEGAANTEAGAGVRKPPGKETAGSGRRWCRGRYGDLRAADEVRDGNRRH